MSDADHSLDAATRRAEEIFYHALEITSVSERTEYVREVCAEDAVLRSTVERLLASQSEAELFFGEGSPTQISAVEISQTLADIPEFFESLNQVLPDDDEVGKSIGNYKLLQKIGEGGGGNVYLAEQVRPVRRQVALKILKLGMDTKRVIARFEAERQALAMMEHPNIAHVLNAGETETGRPFFVMELVHGIRITKYCEENKLGVPDRLELFIQVCHAIQHAHQKGIIHRDIKPSNVLITLHDGIPMPKIIDFGIAKAVSGNPLGDDTINTQEDPLIGTPVYMSPEQASFVHADVDMRSDIYSLGILLYELLCGQPPFSQKELLKSGLDEMRRILRDCEPPRPSAKFRDMTDEDQDRIAGNRALEPARLAALLAGDLDWIIVKALAKDREHRYQTADGFAADVLRYLHHEPVVARPPSRRYRFRKLVYRNKGVFASVGAISIALIAGLGMSSWLYIRERAALREVERARQNEAALRMEAETRERITQAAVLLSRNEMADADALVQHVDLPVIRPSLEAANVFSRLGRWHVARGAWAQAADRLLKMAQANRVDQTDMTDSATRALLQVGPALVAAGDMDNFRAFALDTMDHFVGTPNPIAAEQVLKICIIAPFLPSYRSTLEPMAALVESSFAPGGPQGEWEVYLYAWRAFALAGYELRVGNSERAVFWAEQSLAYDDVVPTRIAMAHAVLAMARHRLGQDADARFDLALARALVGQKFPYGLDRLEERGDQQTGFWNDWIMAYVLLLEADAVVLSSGDSP